MSTLSYGVLEGEDLVQHSGSLDPVARDFISVLDSHFVNHLQQSLRRQEEVMSNR